MRVLGRSGQQSRFLSVSDRVTQGSGVGLALGGQGVIAELDVLTAQGNEDAGVTVTDGASLAVASCVASGNGTDGVR